MNIDHPATRTAPSPARRGHLSQILRTLWVAALLAAVPVPAFSQQSPELPASGTLLHSPAVTTRFYKGKGPGRGNSYVERYEEDYAYLRDPTRSDDPFDPLKYIPFDPNGDVYLTLNGEARFRYDNTDHKNFAIAASATPPKPGKPPVFTPGSGTSTNQLYKQRYALGGDLHLGPYLRFYADLYHGQQTGHNAGSVIPGNLRSDLSVVNGFGEIHHNTEASQTGLRLGRQEIFFGNNLQVRANVSTNLPSPVFDGVRAFRDWGNARVDAFAYNLVKSENGVLQERDNPHTNLWGVYGSYDLPDFEVGATAVQNSIDLFYFGWRSAPFSNGKGSGIYNDAALLTGNKIIAATGAGFMASQDHRGTFGLRTYGKAGDLDYDWQGALQTGSYAGMRVAAFAANTDTGYTFHDLPWEPRIGAHLDIASGGVDKRGNALNTYQPMYPDTHYYAPNNEFAPANFYDFAPRISIKPTERITIEYYYSFLWRYSDRDAIYTGAPWPGANGQNAYAVTILASGRVIGRQSDIRIGWRITPHLLTLFEFGLFTPGSAIRRAGGRTTTFLDANLRLRF